MWYKHKHTLFAKCFLNVCDQKSLGNVLAQASEFTVFKSIISYAWHLIAHLHDDDPSSFM